MAYLLDEWPGNGLLGFAEDALKVSGAAELNEIGLVHKSPWVRRNGSTDCCRSPFMLWGRNKRRRASRQGATCLWIRLSNWLCKRPATKEPRSAFSSLL